VCGAPDQDTVQETEQAGADGASVISGVVVSSGAPVAGAYVRLLDRTGEFTAEVVSSATGRFRFFAAPGDWTVRALHTTGTGQTSVTVDRGVAETELRVG
jgi:hypothetical protein